MDKIVISGGNKLQGSVKVSGAKNVAMKVILAGLLTNEEIIIHNVPLISSVYGTCEIVKELGVKIDLNQNHTLKIKGNGSGSYTIPLELGGLFRTATMVIGPLLARFGHAVVPNPGGCRLGKRPIERHVEGLRAMGARIDYKDGYFNAVADKLNGCKYRFARNTHTGTETMILAAVLASGETILENAAEEPEINDLILLLVQMGAKIKRVKPRTIIVSGVKKLRGTEYTIMPDRNEVVTFAIAAITTEGDVTVYGTQRQYLKSFLAMLDETGAGWDPIDENTTRFYFKDRLSATRVTTGVFPGFMTDWQAPWALLMTKADGQSEIHETVYEDRFGYVTELRKIGAKIDYFNPKVSNPLNYYNFNWSDRTSKNFHAVRIYGPTVLHNGVMEIMDLRAGATLVLGALTARGNSVLYGINHIDRGYEKIEERLRNLGADIQRIIR